MATILEQYHAYRDHADSQIANGQFKTEQLLLLHELQYRIHVLETCMNFCKTAPVTVDQHALGYHYRVVDAFITCILQERRFGVPADEKLKQQRETAFQNFQTIVGSFRKGFQSFSPSAPDSYKASVSKMINTILPAWLQYRNTYTPM